MPLFGHFSFWMPTRFPEIIILDMDPITGLVLLVATRNCWVSYKNEYAGLLVLHLLPFLNPWLIDKLQPAEIFSISITFVYVLQNWLNWFHFPFFKGGLLITLLDCMIFLSPLLDVTRMFMSTVSFLAQLYSGIFCLQNAFV